MIGTAAGDIAGSTREFAKFKTTDLSFELFPEKSCFTDDTILTAAIADALYCKDPIDEIMCKYANVYPHGGYGGMFVDWIKTAESQRRPYNSWGNGSAMRTSPIAYWFDTVNKVIEESQKCAELTHNHPEGIKGAQSVALAIYAGRHQHKKDVIKSIAKKFEYEIIPTDEIRKDYKFYVSCQRTVPEAFSCVLESTDFEHAIRLAISLGGDSDTIAAITGSIAEAYYGMPENIANEVYDRLDNHIRTVFTTFLDKKAPDLLVGKWKENKEENLFKDEKENKNEK